MFWSSGILLAPAWWLLVGSTPPAPGPFVADEHTLLLYHFDDGAGLVAKDSGPHGYNGQVQGGTWTAGKFGGALLLDGKDDCVFRELTEAIRGVRQITVECWFKQENPQGRQFLVGKDVGFHFDLSNGAATSMSLYHEGSRRENAQGLRHQHLGTAIGPARFGRWHHLATTYDGSHLSFFFDGVLKGRVTAAKDFLLGVRSRGLWVGCYVGQDFWFNGKIDELRISNCVRYDPGRKLTEGQQVFEMPRPARYVKAVRQPSRTGSAQLRLRLRKLHGGPVNGWIYLKAPGRRAVIVGRFDLAKVGEKLDSDVELDVSDEYAGAGSYLLALETDHGKGYFSLTEASLLAQGKVAARWTGQARSRRTFQPPVLVPLQVGDRAQPRGPATVLLLPQDADRVSGDLEIDQDDDADTPCLFGEGLAEYWLDVPSCQAYHVWLRYAAPGTSPCDIVVDGQDLNDYNMCARNRTDSAHPRDAFWEYQGTTVLTAGPHWIRLQDVLPEIVGLRLVPTAVDKSPAIPWCRFPVPEEDFLAAAGSWQSETLFGLSQNAKIVREANNERSALRFSVRFANRDPRELFGGDAIRLVRAGHWDLQPFGQLTFTYDSQGTEHVVSLRLVDLKGDEKAPLASTRCTGWPTRNNGTDLLRRQRCLRPRPRGRHLSRSGRGKRQNGPGQRFFRSDQQPEVPPPGHDRGTRGLRRQPCCGPPVNGSCCEDRQRGRAADGAAPSALDKAGRARATSAVRRLRAQAGDTQDARLPVAHDRGPQHSAGDTRSVPQALRLRRRLLAAHRHVPFAQPVRQRTRLPGGTGTVRRDAQRSSRSWSVPVRYLGLRAA